MFGKKEAQPPIKSLLAKGCRIEGELRFSDGMRIDGEVIGNIRGIPDEPSLLVISESATIHGGIEADHVIIDGIVRGPVRAGELLELQPRARVEGDIDYRSLEVHHGAVVTGQLRPLPALDEKPLLKLAANNP